MEESGDLVSRMERTELQLKALLRTARTTLQVVADLREHVSEYAEEQDAQPREGMAYVNGRNERTG